MKQSKMEQINFLRTHEVFLGSDTVRKYSFKTTHTRDSYALLAKENRHLAMDFAILREESAHFQEDCFECLSPRWHGPAGRVASNQPHKMLALS